MPSTIEERIDVINQQQKAITLRLLSSELSRQYIQESEGYLSDGAGMYAKGKDFQCPPLRVRNMQKQVELTASNTPPSSKFTLPDDFLSMSSVLNQTNRSRRLDYTTNSEFAANLERYKDGIAQWTIVGNVIEVGMADVASEQDSAKLSIIYHAKMPSVLGDEYEQNWCWANYPTLYYHAVAAQNYQAARLDEQAAIWWNRFCDKVIHLNRTYGRQAVLKGATMSYNAGRQLGAYYPKFRG